MQTWEIITAIVGGLIFLGLWLDKQARKREREELQTYDSFFEDDDARSGGR